MRIKDICDFGFKSKILARSARDEGQYQFFSSSSDTSKRYNEYQYDLPALIMGTGGNATLHFCEEKFSVSTDCLVLQPKEGLNIKYLYYFLKAKMYILEAGFRGAGLKHTNKNYIGNIDVGVIPDVSVQEITIKVFERLDFIQKFKTDQLVYLDNLIKSRFVEMFDTLINNKNGFNIIKFEEIIDVLTDYNSNGSYKSIADNVTLLNKPDYAYMVRTTDLETNNYTKDVIYVDKHAYEFLEKSKVFGKELIMNKIGSAGKIYLMPNITMPTTLGMNQFLIRTSESVNMSYLYYYLKTQDGENEIFSKIQGAVTKTITKDAVRNIKILFPPIELQNQFASFVQQVDKSKFAIQRSLNETQLLYNALMQEYFG